jgi:hypothetical protein
MRFVLFGAGASYGCGDVLPKKPPLGRDLFPVLRRIYPTWRSIPQETSALFETHFESGMADVIERYGFAVGPLMQEMAIFFSIFYISERADNRYIRILENAKGRNDIIWSTINYECLLELAVARIGRPVNYFADQGSANDSIPIWKLHGSCNFRVKGLDATRGVSYSGTGIVFEGGIEPIKPAEVRTYYSGNTALYPAMALYAGGKPISMSPAVIKQAQERWNKHVRASERGLLIGVCPNPEDVHLWTCLNETKAELGYVGDEKAFAEWIASYRRKLPSKFIGPRWEEVEENITEFLLE